uniref:Uncharacterized protein n=1 Tax=Amphimedon queenslandica TaxID=400682 RepID=A0A1X7VFW8_AMPQE
MGRNAPDIKTVEGRRKAPGFIDTYVSCHIPKDGEDDDLKGLALQLQKRNHTQMCRKNGRNCCTLITQKNEVTQLV